MRKRSAIVRLSIIVACVILGIILTVVPIRIPGTFTTFKSFSGGIKLGLDLKGGVYAVYEVSEEEENRENLSQRLDGTVDRLYLMLQSAGYSEATVAKEGTTRIRVEVPDVNNPDELFKIIGEPAEMVFTIDDADTGISGTHVTDAYAVSYNGTYAVQLIFNSTGADLFYEVTSNNVEKQMVISINGETISSATIKSAISGGKPVIEGNFSYADADKLAKQILSGAFDVKLDLKDTSTISATLGMNALKMSMIAGVISILFIVAYLTLWYRGMGASAGLALLINSVLLLFFMMALPGTQLTLPGIAGIILSIGMAVDTNIVIFERIKDEYQLGKSVNASIHSGFKKSFWILVDSNITGLISAIVLYLLGKGSIQGFGMTLFLGIIISFIATLFITRGLIKLLLNITQNPKFYNLKRNENTPTQEDSLSAPADSNDAPKSEGGLVNA